MLTIHDFSQGTRVSVLGPSPSLEPALEREVERLWQAAQARAGTTLFNGTILCAVDVRPDEIICQVAQYRLFMAQQARPDLFAELHLRPLAVSGLLSCPQGVVLGRRAATVSQQPGQWELVPSGGMDGALAVAGGQVDFLAQLRLELTEETGLDARHVHGISPFCLVEDEESHVLDIAVAMQTAVSDQALRSAHLAHGSREYDKLMTLPIDGVLALPRGMPNGIAHVSAAIAGRFAGQLPSAI